jgi:glycine hydroxymethyltransferase
VPYFVDPASEALDYDAIERIALEAKPQIIVAGYSAYPKIIDWKRFREIADKVGAYLLADIAHISGLVAAGIHPSPIGIADVVSTTTHKSLCGPRGAMLMTHRRDLARKLDRAVFPGEQGGPHVNTIAALAVALKLAKTDQFRALQQRIVDNAGRLAQQLEAHGIRVVGGGSENHLLLIDTKSVKREDAPDGVHLTGDMGSRILDVAGIVVNRNTIPGDKGALSPTGIRMGTVWISQLGFGPAEIDLLAEAIATVLKGTRPYIHMDGTGGKRELRARVDYRALKRGRQIVRQLRRVPAAGGGDGRRRSRRRRAGVLNYALTSDVAALADGKARSRPTCSAPISIWTRRCNASAATEYTLQFERDEDAAEAAEWLQALSDGYAQFDDVYARLPGPVVAQVVPAGIGRRGRQRHLARGGCPAQQR